MNRRIQSALLILGVTFLISCNSDKTCTIHGSVTVPDPAKDYYAVLVCGRSDVDTCLVKDGAFTLKTVQNPRAQQRIRFIDAEGEEVGNGDIFDMMEIVADTRKMTVDFNTQQSSGSPLTAAMNDMIHKVYQLLEGSEPEMDDPMAAMDSCVAYCPITTRSTALNSICMILEAISGRTKRMILLNSGP